MACVLLHISTRCCSRQKQVLSNSSFFLMITNRMLKLLLYLQNVMLDIGYRTEFGDGSTSFNKTAIYLVKL